MSQILLLDYNFSDGEFMKRVFDDLFGQEYFFLFFFFQTKSCFKDDSILWINNNKNGTYFRDISEM